MQRTDDNFEYIKKKLEAMQIYKTSNGYEYFVYPYKGITPINDKETEYLAKVIASKISRNVDLIFTIETDGIFTALPVALLLKKPLVSARLFDYRMAKSFNFVQSTGYRKRKMYFYFDTKKIKKIAIVDCILSTGGTIKSVMDLFKKLGVEIDGVYTVINKLNYSDTEFVNEIEDILFSIFDVEIRDKKIVAGKSRYNK